ncbi:MAG TPA: D-2-hydroxyacid dehydrogenase [Polyangia bacterium]
MTSASSPQAEPVIWCNLALPPPLREALEAGVGKHRLIWSPLAAIGNNAGDAPDPTLEQADFAFGQPHAAQCASLARLRWVHLSSAGYTSFAEPAIRTSLIARGALLTTSSSVYAEPCAQHALAFLLAHARRLPASWQDQQQTRSWPKSQLRREAQLLHRQTVLLVGMGSIARRLCALLAPFELEVIGFRRRPTGSEPVTTLPLEALDDHLPRADFVIDLLPGAIETNRLFSAERIRAMKPGSVFLNIGRGTTVDQDALVGALTGGVLGAAYLDVTEPEPLPIDHPLWTAPNCTITPHTAGGHQNETERLVAHFLDNLARQAAGQPLRDRVV